ncbi:hypothetical protein [Gordonia crocea]|nr:hypothetical protein [Gordonia crocea]
MSDDDRDQRGWLAACFTGRFSMWVTYPVIAFILGVLLAWQSASP